MKALHIKKDDLVVVVSGEDKGVRGKVIAVSPEEGKVMVEGANIVSKHSKARRQGEVSSIVKTEGAMYASKVMLICSNSKCEKNGKGTRVKHTVVDGKKIRVCAKCGKEI